MLYFTSDLHLGHENVIRYSGRPFKNAKEMDSTLIANWNARVQDKDEIYVVGDFSFHPPHTTESIYNALNGKKHLVRGNHDKQPTLRLPWVSQSDLKVVKYDSEKIILCHYSMRVWASSHHGSWMLYGHSHGNLSEPKGKTFDVGVDSHDYYPWSFTEVKAKMDTKAFEKVDHHDVR